MGKVTDNELVPAKLDLDALKGRFTVYSAQAPNDSSLTWDKKPLARAALLDALEGEGIEVCSTATVQEDEGAYCSYVLVEGHWGSSRRLSLSSEAAAATGLVCLRLKAVRLETLPEHILLRLLVNGSSRFRLFDSAVNVTGRYIKLLKATVSRLYVIEATVTKERALVVGARTMSSLASLWAGQRRMPEEDDKQREKKDNEKKRLLSVPVYRIGDDGLLHYSASREDKKDLYAFGLPKCSELKRARVPFLSFKGKEPRETLQSLKGTRAYIATSILSDVEALTNGAVELNFREFEDIDEESPFVRRSAYEKLKPLALERLNGGSIDVVPATKAQEPFATLLADKLSGYSHRMELDLSVKAAKGLSSAAAADSYGIEVIADADEGSDYSVSQGVPLQHVTEEHVAKLMARNDDALLGSLLKELSIKSEILAGRLIAGSGSPICNSYALLASGKGPKCRYIGMSVDALGNLTFGTTIVDGFLGDWGSLGIETYGHEIDFMELYSCLCHDSSKYGTVPNDGNVIVGSAEGCVLIEDTGLIAMPNEPVELFEFLSSVPDASVSVRQKSNGMFQKHFSSICGIHRFEKDGFVHYLVGEHDGFNPPLASAPHIRKLVPLEGKDFSDQVISSLMSGLSRWGRPTVLPIGAKYLREYAKMMERIPENEEDVDG